MRRQESAGLHGGDRDAGSAKRHLNKCRKVEFGRRDKKDVLAPELNAVIQKKGLEVEMVSDGEIHSQTKTEITSDSKQTI